MKSLLVPLALCAALGGCASYGTVGYAPGYAYPYAGYAYGPDGDGGGLSYDDGGHRHGHRWRDGNGNWRDGDHDGRGPAGTPGTLTQQPDRQAMDSGPVATPGTLSPQAGGGGHGRR